MYQTSQHQNSPKLPWMFDLEGIFLGFPDSHLTKVKYLTLEVDRERLTVTLPKELRHPMRLNLQPGDRVRCVGRSRLNHKAQTVELKAYQVFPMPLANRVAAGISTVSLSDSFIANTTAQLPFKISVCCKPNCQKQGGRALVAALERNLTERNLRDRVTIEYTGCQKRCSHPPSFNIMCGDCLYDRISFKDLHALLDEYFCDESARTKFSRSTRNNAT